MDVYNIYDLTKNNPDFYRGFMESSFVTSYLDIFNYPPIDTTDADTQKLIEILKDNPTTDNKYKFDLRFGKGAHEAYI